MENVVLKKSFKKTWAKHKNKYYLIIPFAVLFTVFTLIPVFFSIGLSLTDFNGFKVPNFVGLKNYVDLIVSDQVFKIAIKNTLFLALITGPVSYIMCFVFAWLINELNPKLRAFMTLVFYAPSISGNAYLIWRLIFSSDMYGYANAMLLDGGLINEPFLWLQNPDTIIWILILVQLWLSLGVSFLAFIAGLQNVDPTLYEAGAVDGVRNRWQELWYITLPSMKPQLMFGAVMQITTSLSLSAISIQLAGFPSTEYAGHTIVTHLYDFTNNRYELGYASAIATILFLMMLFTNLVVQKLLRKVGS